MQLIMAKILDEILKSEATEQIKARACQLPQSKDMGLVTHDLTVSGNNATSLLPHYTWLHHWVVGSTHLTNTFTHQLLIQIQVVLVH